MLTTARSDVTISRLELERLRLMRANATLLTRRHVK
jgi:hypothetical protein